MIIIVFFLAKNIGQDFHTAPYILQLRLYSRLPFFEESRYDSSTRIFNVWACAKQGDPDLTTLAFSRKLPTSLLECEFHIYYVRVILLYRFYMEYSMLAAQCLQRNDCWLGHTKVLLIERVLV